MVVPASRAKVDLFSATEQDFEDWLHHFDLCAEINEWSTHQRCQQLAVSLRGNAQRVYLGLSLDDKSTYDDLVSALRRRLQPKQQRAVHKLAFFNRKRRKGESLVELANDLRHLATRAFVDRDVNSVEEELVDQFVNALASRDLRLGVSQIIPKTLDEAVCQGLRLEALFTVENHRSASAMAVNNTTVPPHEQTADVNIAGSDSPAPAWARDLFQRQNALLERVLESSRNHHDMQKGPKGVRDECYRCGRKGHFRRDCPQREREQGNGYRAGPPRW